MRANGGSGRYAAFTATSARGFKCDRYDVDPMLDPTGADLAATGWELDVDPGGGELILAHVDSGRSYVLNGEGEVRVAGDEETGGDRGDLRTALASSGEDGTAAARSTIDAQVKTNTEACTVECDETTGELTIHGAAAISVDAPVVEVFGLERVDVRSAGGVNVTGEDRFDEPQAPTDRWTTFQRNVARQGYVPEPAGPRAPVTQRWQFETDDGCYGSPAVSPDTVYAGDEDGVVYAINRADGSERWRTETDGLVRSAPALADGRAYVATRQGTLYALDAGTGDVLWQFATGEDISNLPAALSSPAVHDGMVYFGTPGGSLYAVETDGTEQWRLDADGDVYASPAIANGTVYIADTAGGVYARDATDGTSLWSASVGSGVDASPAVAGGTVYVSVSDGTVRALDAGDGTESWSFDTGSFVMVSSPAVTGDRVYVGSGTISGSETGYLHAIDAGDGTELWRFEAPHYVISSPAVTSDTVYVGCDDSNVYAIDTGDGTEVWRFDTGGEEDIYNDVSGSPAVVEGVVYVGAGTTNIRGDVFAIEADTS
jgi:outer membrane protein assembly factor BamB